VNALPTEPNWAGKRVNYGKDRCAYVPKSQQAAAQQAQAAAAQSLVASTSLTPAATSFSPFNPYFSQADMMGGMGAGGGAGMQGMNRTIYLGAIHPETTTEDLCNAIRGGVLQSIRYMQDKHIAVRFPSFLFVFWPLDLIFVLCDVVCDICRPSGGIHVFPSCLLPRSDFEQPATEDWLGEKLWPAAYDFGVGGACRGDQERVYRERRGL
jgi:hypothetical protein